MPVQSYSILPLFYSVDRLIFFVALAEMGLMVWAALTLRSLLRLNLTLKPSFNELLQHLKDVQQKSYRLNTSISSNKALWQQYWVNFIKQLPQPLRWMGQLASWLL